MNNLRFRLVRAPIHRFRFHGGIVDTMRTLLGPWCVRFELLLGLPAMSQYDAAAISVSPAFGTTDSTPFSVVSTYGRRQHA